MLKKLKIKILAIFFVILSMLPSSCSIINNGYEEFGDADFIEYFGNIPELSAIKINDEIYFRVGNLTGDITKKDNIAVINTEDNYSFIIYTTNEYEGYLIVNAYSKVNLVNANSIYVSINCENIPKELVEDFPHKDTIFNGGREVELNGTIYVEYAITRLEIPLGDILFTEDNKDYYYISDNWIGYCDITDSYHIYYDSENVDSLPVNMLIARLYYSEENININNNKEILC